MTLVMPNTELLAFIRNELNEDVNTRDDSVRIIKEWLLKQPHLPDTLDDIFIMAFLRGSNYSLERCKQKLDMYFTMRTAVPEFFSNRDVKRPELQAIINKAQCAPLPVLTKEGRRVTIIRGLDKAYTFGLAEDALKLVLMVGDVRLVAELEGVAGDIFILDADVVSPTHFAKITPSIVKKFLVCVEEAYPVKLKEVHVVNANSFIETIFNWVKPLLKEKIKNRVYLHSDDMESLYKFVPKDVLPEEYGGTGGKLQDMHNEWVKKLEELTPWFKEQENIKADESKRPGKPTNYDDLFGVDGSFRQLCID